MAIHSKLPFIDSHFAHAFEYADQTARESATGFLSEEIGKLARQLDTNTLWMLTSTTPTWAEIGSTLSANEIIVGTVAPVDTSKLWLDTNDSPATLKYFDGSSYTSVAASGSGGGTSAINSLDIRPALMKLDAVDVGADRGIAWNLVDTVDFNPVDDGTIWFGFKLPSGWLLTSDIVLEIQYNCNGNDQGKGIVLKTDVWTVDTGDTPNILSPDATNTDIISTSISNIDKFSNLILTNGKIPAASLNVATNSIMVRIKRETSNVSDNYTGTFQLVSIQVHQ